MNQTMAAGMDFRKSLFLGQALARLDYIFKNLCPTRTQLQCRTRIRPPTDPNLSVVPSETPSTRQRGDYNKAVEAELSDAQDICTKAGKSEYAQALATKKIDAAFVTALVNLIVQAGGKSQAAVEADGDRKDATQGKSNAQEDVVNSLQTIQSAARLEYLPEHPAKLDAYGVGEPLNPSQPVLERKSKALIEKAEAERPGGLDTAFLNTVKDQRAIFTGQGDDQDSHGSKGKQERTMRDALLKEIVARRKKIQYAADALWPHYKETSVQARKDFKLPENRPYSY
jgi:hypothetical protein